MQFITPDTPERLRLIAEWLSRKENHQWLDFGDGRQVASAEWLAMSMRRGHSALRLFTSDHDDQPIGVIALANITANFRTANIWVILGDRSRGGSGYATRATEWMLSFGFRELGLRAINTWIVEHNPSVHIARKVGFKPIGRQRACHEIDGHVYDRLWFDLLASEHEALESERRAAQPA